MRVTQAVIVTALAVSGVVAGPHDPVRPAAPSSSSTSSSSAHPSSTSSGSHSAATHAPKPAAAAKNVVSKVQVQPPAHHEAAASSSTSTSKPSTSSASASSSTSSAKATGTTPKKPAATTPAEDKPLVKKLAGLAAIISGNVPKQPVRKAKAPGDYVRQQKSEKDIKPDSTGTKQPASLSDPHVSIMVAMGDLLKRYAGQAKPDKAQFQEDIKTVFESRAEKRDLSTKHFKQNYKMREVKSNGVGKRSTKTKRDLDGEIEARDVDAEAEIELEAREADADIDFEAREAEPEADAFADPEATVYEEDLQTRNTAEDFDTLISRKSHNNDNQSKSEEEDDDDDDDDESSLDTSSADGSTDAEDYAKLRSSLNEALKKLAAKKLAAKNRKAKKARIARIIRSLKAALEATKARSEGDGDGDGTSTEIPPNRPQEPGPYVHDPNGLGDLAQGMTMDMGGMGIKMDMMRMRKRRNNLRRRQLLRERYGY